MARIALNCSCGWNFFIPGATPGHEVTCPSCGQTVRIPGRKPGQPVPTSAGEIALEKQRQQSAVKMMIGGGIAAVILIGTVLVFVLGGGKTPENPGLSGGAPQDELTRLGNQPGNRPKRPDPSIELPPPPPPVPPIYNSTQIMELRRDVYSSVWLLNMTALISEVMRYRNLTNEWAQFQADIARYDGKIKTALGELAKVGEKVALEPYMAQGDQVFGFVDRDFTTMRPADAAQFLHSWIFKWQASPNLAQVNLTRGTEKMTLYLSFPEETKELLALVRHPALGELGTPSTSAPGAVGETTAIPADVLKDINSRFDALPPGYRGYVMPAERKRLEDLALSKRGSYDDVEWLKGRILAEVIPSFQRESDMIRSKVLELEPKLKENMATDVIIRKNGTKVEGQIIQKTAEFVKVKARFGSVTISAEEIERIELGKGAATEFPGKLAEAKGHLDKMVPLLAWCAEKGLKFEKEYVAYSVLLLDASNEKARTAVGLTRPAVGPGQPGQPPKYPELNSAAKIEPVERTIDLIAGDVTTRNKIWGDVVTEMRRRTETLTLQTAPLAPAASIKGASVIGNPLTFKPNDLTGPQALEIGSWWSTLSADDRRAFAKYYGMWCAYTRGMKK